MVTQISQSDKQKPNWLVIALTVAKYVITLIIGAVGGGAATTLL